jgi:hypothetical protein
MKPWWMAAVACALGIAVLAFKDANVGKPSHGPQSRKDAFESLQSYNEQRPQQSSIRLDPLPDPLEPLPSI